MPSWTPRVALFLWLGWNVQAMTVVTVDDQDPSITYAPTLSSWGKVDGPGVDAGGTHMMSTDPSATAMLRGRFLNAHFWSAQWPYHVTTDISVDGNLFTANLQDPNAPEQTYGGGATVASSTVFSYWGTATQNHTIVLSVHPGDIYVVLDQFTFDVEDEPATNISPSSSVPASTTATNSIPSSTTSSESISIPQPTDSTSNQLRNEPRKSSTTPIIVAVVIAVLVLALVAFSVFFVCRRRRRPASTRFVEYRHINRGGQHPALYDDRMNDMSDSHARTQSTVMRQGNQSILSYEGAPINHVDYNTSVTISARPVNPPAYQAATAPVNPLRVMNNARSDCYPSNVTLTTPLPPSGSFKQISKPLYQAANTPSSGSTSKGSDGSHEAMESKTDSLSMKKYLQQQPGPSSPIPPPPYQASEEIRVSEKR